MISKRAQSVDSSGIRKVFDLAAKLKDPINLSIGQPDFDAPEEVKQGTIKAINGRKSGYTVTQGIPELRREIRKKYGIADDEKEVEAFVTSGVSGGLLLSYMALLDPGDEILVPDPYFCMYRDLAVLINAVPVYFDCYPDFKLNISKIEAAITPKTKALLLNTPANPTGYALTESELADAIALCKKHGIWLLYDEIYETYSYDHPHVAAFGKYEKTIILNGFSKSHGIPGWRMGYAVGPTRVIQEMLKIQQYSYVCAPSIAQWGCLEGMSVDTSTISETYKTKRDLIYSLLKDKFEVTKPGGAFYIFPKAPGKSGQAFVEKCIANNLLVVPGNVFSRADSHFRISFSASLETLQRGAEVLNRLA